MTNRAFLLKLGNGETPPSYQSVAGLRIRTETINGSGEHTVEATGVFLGSSTETAFRALALSAAKLDCELSFEDGEKLRGRYSIDRLDHYGIVHGEREYTIRLVKVRDHDAPYQAREPALDELESALCAPDWSASLAHVHNAIAYLKGTS